MTKDSKGIRMDKNFLLYLLWRPVDVDMKNHEREIYSTDAFRVDYGNGVCGRLDAVFLYSLLRIAQEDRAYHIVDVSPHAVLVRAGLPTDKWYYQRLEDSLERWLKVSLHFHEFVEIEKGKDKGKVKRVDNVGLNLLQWYRHPKERVQDNTNCVGVLFTEKFREILQNTNYYRRICLTPYLHLKSHVACKLWEHVYSMFYNRTEYKIGVVKLGKYLGISPKSGRRLDAGRVLEYVERAVKELNEAYSDLAFVNALRREGGSGDKEEFLFTLDYEVSGGRGKKVIEFSKKPLGIVKPRTPKKSKKSILTEVPTPILSSAKPTIESSSGFKFSHLDPEIARNHMRRLFPMMFEISGREASALHAHYLEVPRDDDGDPINFGIPEAEAFIKSYRKALI